MWKEATAPDGRKYYYRPGTSETTWEKPADFIEESAAGPPQTPVQSNGSGAWKEATNPSDGRTYYYNTATKETTWEKPAELHKPQTTALVTTNHDFPDRRRDTFRDQGPPRSNGMPWEQRNDTIGYRGAMPAKLDEPEYATQDEAEAAFFKFLRSQGVKYNTEWPEAVRAVGRIKGYRAFKDPKDRRRAFEKYCVEEKAAEKSREQERKQMQRENFRDMLKAHEEITHYTRWRTARPTIEREVVFRSVKDDEERKQMFGEYVMELQKRYTQKEAENHESAVAELSSLLRSLIVNSQTKWQDALQALEENKRFASNESLRALSKADILKVYETQIRTVDSEKNDTKQMQKQNHFRGQREARDGFRDLLQEHLSAGNIRASTKWKDFHARIAEEPRYQKLLGMPGSSPLDLFWDVIEDEERRLRLKRNDAYDVLEEQQFELTAATAFENFEAVMRSDARTRNIPSQDVLAIFEKLVEKVRRRHEEDRLLAEKDFHNSIDSLRSAIKHMRPAIHADEKFEEVAARIDTLPEARGLEDEARRIAFDKYIRRAQEKAADREKDRARRDRQRNGSRRSYDDERERDRRHRTHSPELDAYEEDRRKAQADRERQYRKASFGLTPPPRDRRDDRDRRERYESVYERERKEREIERERSYISRADPRDRGKISTLDYGDDDTPDSVPGSARKRRESDMSSSSKREPKRARLQSREQATAQAVEVDKEEPALQSGSEEGEIEEV